MTDTAAPGARTVNALESADFAAWPGEYLSLTPAKPGRAPPSVVIAKVSAGRGLRTPLGSLRSLRVSSPVFVTVVVTFQFSTPATAPGPVTLRERPGTAETADAVATRATRAARREVENMVPVSRKGEGWGRGDWETMMVQGTERTLTPTSTLYTHFGGIWTSVRGQKEARGGMHGAAFLRKNNERLAGPTGDDRGVYVHFTMPASQLIERT